ncbi:MAG: hypothetical protein KGJ04_00705 [Gammaproteobacteria bacterium]|nr:hypothetical protein [Gammaproteobacteria bacterium]
MSIGIRFLACATLGAILTAISLSSLAADRRAQFAVMVQVLPRCQWSLEVDDARTGRFAIECTRNTEYSVSLTRGGDLRPDANLHMARGIGSGALQVIPLRVPPPVSTDAAPPGNAPLFLTINY